MRSLGRVALFGLALGLSVAFSASAADEPVPLLKVAAPAGGQLRVRLPVEPGFPKTMSFTAQVPKGKKKSELIDATVALDTLPGQSYVTAKKLESWGYDVGKSKDFLLPELFITAAQIAPKPMKGSDVVIRLTNLKLSVIHDAASKDDTVYFNDLSLSFTALFQGAERTLDPRLSFGDKFLEMNVAAAIVKRPGTDAAAAPEVTASADTKLAPSVGPTIMRGGMPVFAYAAVNGLDSYKKPDGKTTVPVNVAVSSITNAPEGVVVTLGLARGCKIEYDPNAVGQAATGVEAKSSFLPGKIKELRLAVLTGPGLKTQKDVVIKDLPVLVDKNQSEGFMFLGQKFMDTYFTDAVYTNPGDGWKLHGRVSPELLFDIKTRPKKP